MALTTASPTSNEYEVQGVGLFELVMQPVKPAVKSRPVQQPVGPVEPGVVGEDQHRDIEREVGPASLGRIPVDIQQAVLRSQGDAEADQREDQHGSEGGQNLPGHLLAAGSLAANPAAAQVAPQEDVDDEECSAGADDIAQQVMLQNAGVSPGGEIQKCCRLLEHRRSLSQWSDPTMRKSARRRLSAMEIGRRFRESIRNFGYRRSWQAPGRDIPTASCRSTGGTPG